MTRKPTPKDLETFEHTLRLMLGALTGDIKNLENDALGNGKELPKVSSEDGGADAYAQEFSLELLERDENTVVEVMEALDRIKEGSFGRCEACEKWIRKERLRAVPHARNCIDCQRKQEKASF